MLELADIIMSDEDEQEAFINNVCNPLLNFHSSSSILQMHMPIVYQFPLSLPSTCSEVLDEKLHGFGLAVMKKRIW